MIYFEFPCGCLIPTDQIKYTHMKNKKMSRYGYFCPGHDVKATHKVSYCLECKKEIRVKMPQRQMFKRCKGHKLSVLEKQIRKNSRAYRENEKKKKVVKGEFKQPVRALNISDAAAKGINCIPGPQGIKLFYVHKRMEAM
jgi:hypothetical protein